MSEKSLEIELMDEQRQVIDLMPKLGSLQNEFSKFCRKLERELKKIERLELLSQKVALQEVLNKFRNEIRTIKEPLRTERIELLFVSSVILDLLYQGWKLNIVGSRAQIYSPFTETEPHATKEIVRNGHLLGRDAQLKESSVVEFVTSMERRRLTANGWHSIFSLMREGRELAENLRNANTIVEQEERLTALAGVISPYIQFVDGDDVCEHTGLRLGDIWRYFRHTWVSEYKSIPGRSIMILIRDAAAPNHPVIGIAALGNSVVQHSLRDNWIGWHPQSFVDEFVRNPTTKTRQWLLASIDALIDAIYLKDLRDEGICSSRIISKPTEESIQILLKEAEKAIDKHRKNPQKDFHKNQKGDMNSAQYWQSEATTHLYRSKRCRQLARLLSIRKIFQEYGMKTGSRLEMKELLTSGSVKASVAQLVRMIKAEHVGIDMMDITVCGAVAPYNLLLGGKLICMLLCSPEVTQYYCKRYGGQESIIASSMKGKPVIRKPNLVLLCTTSLYGVGSSQYNRVKIPLAEFGGGNMGQIIYENLGHSFGFGTYHFSKDTIDLSNVLISRRRNNRLVNSIFGEGVNPLMRKIREALELVGLHSDGILQHGNRRVIYGIKLAKNFREILLGISQRPIYLIPQTKSQVRTNLIAQFWMRRWLSNRITRPEILDDVAKHTLSYPITHGAAVPLPSTDQEETMPLFMFSS